MAYGVEYYHEYYDIGGSIKHEVEIMLDGYGGGKTIIANANDHPVYLRHVGSQSKFEETIIQGLELTFSFPVPRADITTFDSIFESDYKDYKIRYTVDGTVEFEGYIKPENLMKSYIKNPPTITITLSATDALADLKDIEFLSGSVPINETTTILQILKYALTPIGIELNFQIQLGTYESNYMASTECALEVVRLDTRRFFKNEVGRMTYMSCWEVIETVLKDWNVTFKQNKGVYQITCPFELDSRQFLYDWDTLTASSASPFSTSNVVDITAYEFGPIINQQKIRPLSSIGITFLNKDLGGNVTGLDLDDWGNAPPWTIDFSDGFAVAAGVVTLSSDDNTYADYIELAAFAVSDVAGLDEYLKITFDHILNAHTSADPLKSPIVKITITRPDASTTETYINIEEHWSSYESTMSETFKVVATGNYLIRFDFEQTRGAPWLWTTAEFKIKNFMITKIANIAEGEDISNVIMDEYYLQETLAGFERLKITTLLADVGQVTEVGGLLLLESAGEKITELWRTYGNTEDIALLDIYAQRILTNRYTFKNMLKRVKIHDRDNTLDFNTILIIDSREYVFVSYSRDFRYCEITGDLMELIVVQPSSLIYGDIQRSGLTSIDGENAVASPNVNLQTPGSTVSHNALTGLNTGDYRHLTAAQYTDLTDGGNASIHKHDDRYYTETEVNTWRNSATQTEMGYLHGVTSDIQTQITARAIIGANPADDRLCTWSSATTIQGESNITSDGTDLTIAAGDLKLNKNIDQTGTTAQLDINPYKLIRLGRSTNNADFRVNILKGDNSTTVNHSFEGVGDSYVCGDNGDFGVGDRTPSYKLDVDGTGRFTGNLYGGANVQNLSFASGFQGDKWQITEDGVAEFEDLMIRGGLTAWELIINRLHYQCGGLIIGAGGGKIASVIDPTVGAEVVTFEDPEGNLILPFTEGAIVLMQDFDLNRTDIIKKVVRQVDSINSAGTEVTLEATAGWTPGESAGDDTGIPEIGDEVVAIGHTVTAGLDASLYMSAVDSDNPFLRILDGVDSYAKWSLGDKTTIKVQLGNLAGLANYDIIPATPGYGLYSSNVYLSGKIVASSGAIGGWTIDSESIYTGTKHAGDDWNANEDGITLMDDGSIHAPNFYVNTGGEIGLRQVEDCTFGIGVGNEGMRITTNHIFEDSFNSDLAAIFINYRGYQSGGTKFRNTFIGNGKAGGLVKFNGVDDEVEILATKLIANYYSSDGTQGITDTVSVVGTLCDDSGTIKQRLRTITIKDGLITSIGTLGAATEIPACPV